MGNAWEPSKPEIYSVPPTRSVSHYYPLLSLLHSYDPTATAAFCYLTVCTQLEFGWRFGGTYCLQRLPHLKAGSEQNGSSRRVPSFGMWVQTQLQWRMVSSGMLRGVAHVRTDVSEELSASFIRVTRIGGLGTTLTVTSSQRASVDSYSYRSS
jgi:hypothetical protein